MYFVDSTFRRMAVRRHNISSTWYFVDTKLHRHNTSSTQHLIISIISKTVKYYHINRWEVKHDYLWMKYIVDEMFCLRNVPSTTYSVYKISVDEMLFDENFSTKCRVDVISCRRNAFLQKKFDENFSTNILRRSDCRQTYVSTNNMVFLLSYSNHFVIINIFSSINLFSIFSFPSDAWTNSFSSIFD